LVTVIDAEAHCTAQVLAADFICLAKAGTRPARDLAALRVNVAPMHKALVFETDAASLDAGARAARRHTTRVHRQDRAVRCLAMTSALESITQA